MRVRLNRPHCCCSFSSKTILVGALIAVRFCLSMGALDYSRNREPRTYWSAPLPTPPALSRSVDVGKQTYRLAYRRVFCVHPVDRLAKRTMGTAGSIDVLGRTREGKASDNTTDGDSCSEGILCPSVRVVVPRRRTPTRQSEFYQLTTSKQSEGHISSKQQFGMTCDMVAVTSDGQ